MLLPEQVVPFLQHNDPIVREHVRRYFQDTHDFGPLTADHYWALIDRLGESENTIGFAADLKHVPQTDGSLRRVVRALATKTSERFEFHYQMAAREMELAVLERNRDELLACPQLLPHVREYLELRLNLLGDPPAAAWQRLMRRGHELADQYAGAFNAGLSDALIEAAARGGAPICEQAMVTLADESAAMDWREIFAVRGLGLARYVPAIDALVDRLAIDTDVLREEVNRALARIADPRVIERVVGFYPGKPWHVRLYAHSSLARIKHPESVDALLKLLGVELALDADPDYDDEGDPLIDSVLIDLTELGSLAGLSESRRLIAEFPDDPEALDLSECLIATAVMTGVALPEETAWRKRIEKQKERVAAEIRNMDGMLHGARDHWRKTGMSFPIDDHSDGQDDWDIPDPGSIFPDRFADPVKPIRNTAPKIGRNHPCPCGSGKKYKKCCGN